MVTERSGGAEGIQFRERDGKRSSQMVGKAVYSDAARSVDANLASRIEKESNWRKAYLAPVRELVEAGARSAANAARIAQGGLASAHQSLMFTRGDTEVPVGESFDTFTEQRFETATIKGTGDRERRLMVPFEGRELTGDSLLRQLDRWVDAGIKIGRAHV